MPPVIETGQVELLRRIAARDLDALGELYDQIARPLFSIAHRILHCQEEAEEVIQDVFVQLWTRAEEFDPAKGRPISWLLSITRHRCIDRLRARQRRSRTIVNLNGHDGFVAGLEMDLGQPVLLENDVIAIRLAVNTLPREQRQAIELAFFRGMTHPEIAESLNEPMGTIKARIRRGMLKLREALHEYL